MFKFVGKKRIGGLIAVVVALVAAVGASVSSAFAYRPSYDEYRMGSENHGILRCEGDPSLDVKKMKLTFDIPSFPQVDDFTDINYRSKVTSEYTLYNPTYETVTARLLVPEMEKPNYFTESAQVAPVIKVNGEEMQPTSRHLAWESYGRREGVKISDEWYSDGFFAPDLPVHTYKITGNANLTFAYLKGDIITDYTRARYIADEYDEFSCRYTKDGENLFYILGDDTTVNFDALSFYDYDRYNLVKLSETFTYEEVETVTLKEFVLKTNRPADGISELDWYNCILARFSNGESVCSKSDLTPYGFKKYYEYFVELAPKGELVTSVTFPVYPDVDGSESCQYYYNTASAVCWGGFGKMEVEINTDFYISGNAKDFQKTDTGFKAVYSVVPQGTVYFSLSRNYVGNSGNYSEGNEADDTFGIFMIVSVVLRLAIFIFGSGISFIVLMVKKSKQGQ